MFQRTFGTRSFFNIASKYRILTVIKLKAQLKWKLKRLFLACGVDIRVATIRQFVATYVQNINCIVEVAFNHFVSFGVPRSSGPSAFDRYWMLWAALLAEIHVYDAHLSMLTSVAVRPSDCIPDASIVSGNQHCVIFHSPASNQQRYMKINMATFNSIRNVPFPP